jgi:hypothetical protein
MFKSLSSKKIVVSVATGLLLFGVFHSDAAGAMPAPPAPKPVSRAVDRHTCAPARAGRVGCLAIRRTLTFDGISQLASGPRQLIQPNGQNVFGMTALRKAYGISASGSAGHVIAIIDAFHSGSAFSDLNGYRATWGFDRLLNCSRLSASAASGEQCFRQLHQDGSPSTGGTDDAGWAQETVLDVEMATAMCPGCSITVVEAASTSFADFNAAVELAASLPGVVSISNSYGGPETTEGKLQGYEHAYQAGIAVVASSGDSGYGVESPASFEHVIAVGGTSLFVDGKGTWSRELAWSGAGSGCAMGRAPIWQDSLMTHCPGKANTDVSAVADPATGVAVLYDGQWAIFGGTSASAPIIAGLFALKHNFGKPGSTRGTAGEYLWAHSGSLHDVDSGTNGNCRLFCTAVTGWDAPTGLGTPNGTGGF